MPDLDGRDFLDSAPPYRDSDPPARRLDNSYRDTASALESSIVANASPRYAADSEARFFTQTGPMTSSSSGKGALENDFQATLFGDAKSQVDNLIVKGEQLDPSKLDSLKCFGPPSRPSPTIEAYRAPIYTAPENPYPFDYPNPIAPPSDAPEGRWPGVIPYGWTGAPSYQRGVNPLATMD
ncbi:hypothetical protein [Rhizobium esperanzae]|uniref:hypothetical protein n=1 Tax=Rhizobium esperanzae TaxID=1967781 RepID=UPI00113082EC|nr:hypothetical protein [Rhizobium esperanzae]